MLDDFKKNKNTIVKEAESESQVRKCWHSFSQLRLNIPSDIDFLKQWEIQKYEGYKLIYIEDDSIVIAAAGYRLMHTMAWGKIIYIDDLIAHDTKRGKGYGTILLKYIQDIAKELSCNSVQLDTGYQRHQAHKSYLRNGFNMTCHHMELDLG